MYEICCNMTSYDSRSARDVTIVIAAFAAARPANAQGS